MAARWTKEQEDELWSLWNCGLTNAQIGRAIGRTTDAVRSKLSLMYNGTNVHLETKPKGKQRNCLKCGTTFDSLSAGNRVCGRCKSHDDWWEY